MPMVPLNTGSVPSFGPSADGHDKRGNSEYPWKQ